MAEATVDGGIERVAFDIWRAVHGPPASNDKNMPAAQRALLVYAECLKAAKGIPFDVTKIT